MSKDFPTRAEKTMRKWYQDLVIKADLSRKPSRCAAGMPSIKPYGLLLIWEKMQAALDKNV